jgi:DtxR family Mn-dependent transcriptional regulator
VHSEAEVLEHAVSDRIVDRLDEMLGHPTADPHGDPIPSSEGQVEERQTIPLTEVPEGASRLIVQISDDEPSFLAYLKEKNLVPGVRIKMLKRDDIARTVRVGVEDSETTMSYAVAEHILVKPN